MSEPIRPAAPDGVAPATRHCPAAVDAAFDAAFDDVVVELPCCVTDMARPPAVRKARAACMPDDRLPAVPAVEAAAPVRPELPREIEAFAVLGE
ncbi:hypothetical protein ACN6K4_005996 [Streptomyces hayashii]|uniref:hypothetical protein n=1 Tax=Streptomyces TaxID=1883 RepID=UPI002FEE9A2D